MTVQKCSLCLSDVMGDECTICRGNKDLALVHLQAILDAYISTFGKLFTNKKDEDTQNRYSLRYNDKCEIAAIRKGGTDILHLVDTECTEKNVNEIIHRLNELITVYEACQSITKPTYRCRNYVEIQMSPEDYEILCEFANKKLK